MDGSIKYGVPRSPSKTDVTEADFAEVDQVAQKCADWLKANMSKKEYQMSCP